jgi:hypothetical protein
VRRIFGPKREEDGSWRKLHNDEIYRLDEVGGTCGTHGRGAYRGLVGWPEGKRQLGRPRCR